MRNQTISFALVFAAFILSFPANGQNTPPANASYLKKSHYSFSSEYQTHKVDNQLVSVKYFNKKNQLVYEQYPVYNKMQPWDLYAYLPNGKIKYVIYSRFWLDDKTKQNTERKDTVKYIYDDNGRLIGKTNYIFFKDKFSEGGVHIQKNTQEINDAAIAKKLFGLGNNTIYRYNKQGKLIEELVSASLQYDYAGTRSSSKKTLKGGQIILLKYTYNDTLLVQKKRIIVNGYLAGKYYNFKLKHSNVNDTLIETITTATTYKYDENNRLIVLASGQSSGKSEGGYNTKYKYNKQGKPVTSVTRAQASETLTTYSYLPNGKPAGETVTFPVKRPNDTRIKTVTTHEYDSKGREIKETITDYVLIEGKELKSVKEIFNEYKQLK